MNVRSARRTSVLTRVLVVASMLATMLVAVFAAATPAQASDPGYPWASAPCGTSASCSGTSGTYGWYEDENGDGHLTGNSCGGTSPSGECFDPYGYEYRNCTSYVAWRLTSLGIPASLVSGRGNGGQWDDSSTGVTLTTTPEVGDAAVIEPTTSNPFGHVAYVEAVQLVSGAYQVKVSQYNANYDGTYSESSAWVAASHYGNYVDFNGVGTPLGGSSSGLGKMGPTAPLQDYAIYRFNPQDSTGYWYAKENNYGTAGNILANLNGWAAGSPGDISLTCDANGDGISDVLIYRVVNGYGTFYAEDGRSPHGALAMWGAWLGSSMPAQSGDIPVVGDFDGDHYCDFGIYRLVSGVGRWYIDSGTTGQHTALWGAVLGAAGDIPVTGDVNGDGIADFGVWRLVNGTDGTWYFDSGANGQPTPIWNAVHGSPGDVPIVGDVDGDGIADFGIYRVSNGTGYWYFKSSANGQPTSTWGAMSGGWTGDVPLVGNFG